MLNVYRAKSAATSYLELKRNPIPYLEEVLRSSGDFARIDIFPFRFFLVNDPELIREVLIEKNDLFIIRGGVSRGLSRLIGNGILTNHGDAWRASRRGLQPLFSQELLERHSHQIAVLTQESIARWHGKTLAINRELLALSCRITCSALFKFLPGFEDALEFADSIWTLQTEGMRRYMSGLDLASWVPIEINRRVSHAISVIRRLAERCVSAGAAQPVDEILSVFFAGTESPANMLCWALWLLEEHPEWRERATTDPDSLTRVISETLRLFPAGWAFERCAVADTRLGGERIPKGSRILISPYFLHRNVRFWRDPGRFDPMRFKDDPFVPAGIPKYAYLPFGAGPRSCIGARMAWSEMRGILGAILRQCEWKTTGAKPVPYGSFKIRLGEPLIMSFSDNSARAPRAN